jgi:ankyrin repeat protein
LKAVNVLKAIRSIVIIGICLYMTGLFSIVATAEQSNGDKWATIEQARQKLASLNIPYNDGAFAAALFNNDQLVVKLFIEAGKDVNKPLSMNIDNKDRQCLPLLIAAHQNHTDLSLMLMEFGADPKLKTYSGMGTGISWNTTPLEAAVYNNNKVLVKSFIDAGANAKSAVFRISPNTTIDTIQLLVQAGADIHAVQNQRNALLAACCNGASRETVAYLIKSGLDVNSQDDNGISALWLAVYDNRPDLVGLLLENGANVNIRTKDGETVLELAKFKSSYNKINYDEVFKLLKNAGAK